MRPESGYLHPLAGDRALEWSWVVMHLPSRPCRILDLGCVGSALSGIASRLGHFVTSVDLNDIEYEMPRVSFSKGDINMLDFQDNRFDIIINCSFIEHVGLENRYGSARMTDGDLLAMKKLRGLFGPEGRMILTVPVGVDATFAPFHRIYGARRLSFLLDRYDIVNKEFWAKKGGVWVECKEDIALNTRGSSESYAIGLFVLSGARAE